MYKLALIVDDDPDLCTLFKAMLQRYIPDVRFVYDISSCKRMLGEIKPEVVFLDNNLPDGRGVTFIKELKLLLPEARIVIISAMCTLKTEALENGADMFIEKPLTEASVQEALGLRSEI